jgi:putative DNA primase/helicase
VAHDVTSIDDLGASSPQISLLEQVHADTGNAQRFLAIHRNDVRYCHAFKSWFFWDGRRWRRDDQEHVVELAQQVLMMFLQQALDQKERDAEKYSKASLNAPRIKALLELGQAQVAIRPQEFDHQPDLLVFANGTVDLRTGTLHGFRREDFITKIVNFNYTPDVECPLFLEVIRRLMGWKQDEDRANRLVDALQVYFGYSLTGHTSGKAVFMLIGPKDTGKTTVLELFCKLLKEHSTLIRIETLMEGPAQRSLGNRADLADLHGANFARTSETEEGKRLAESQLKYITQGMGSIRVERKYENPFDFEETHKLWIDANHKPVIRGTDSSIWDRLFIVPFDVVISDSEKDPELIQKLLAEAEGVLAWAVAGAVRWYEGGRRLPRPEEVRAAGDNYRADMDTVGRFLADDCEVGREFFIASSSVYEGYRRWAGRVGEHAMSQKAFSSRMKNRPAVTWLHKESGTVFYGVRLRQESSDPDEE